MHETYENRDVWLAEMRKGVSQSAPILIAGRIVDMGNIEEVATVLRWMEWSTPRSSEKQLEDLEQQVHDLRVKVKAFEAARKRGYRRR